MILTELFIRPNGKLYVPRKGVRVAPWANDDDELTCGCIVLGTHDVDRALQVAYYATRQYPHRPLVGWWRLGYSHGWRKNEPTWIDDSARGAPGVMFEYIDDRPADWPSELVWSED